MVSSSLSYVITIVKYETGTKRIKRKIKKAKVKVLPRSHVHAHARVLSELYYGVITKSVFVLEISRLLEFQRCFSGGRTKMLDNFRGCYNSETSLSFERNVCAAFITALMV